MSLAFYASYKGNKDWNKTFFQTKVIIFLRTNVLLYLIKNCWTLGLQFSKNASIMSAQIL